MIHDPFILQDAGFIERLMSALPFGAVVVDASGRVQAANDIMAHVPGDKDADILGKMTGEVLGCLHSFGQSGACSDSGACNDCDIRRIARRAFDTQKSQRSLVHLEVRANGHVEDLAFMLNAIPFTYLHTRFSLFMIENMSRRHRISRKPVAHGFRGMIGREPKMLDLFETIKRIARTDAPVLIQGETGVGKELVARAIHQESVRVDGHFVPVNCGALPAGLLESELFGHVRGAFTGATRDKKGRFELSNGGTLFLDEIAELGLPMQAELLRVLQDGTFERVGDTKTLHTDARVISATNKDLESAVGRGTFRKDLYYRLSVMPVTVPPLRERREDIPLLVDHFLARFQDAAQGEKITMSPEARHRMLAYDWPGNVRELESAVRFALATCRGTTITPSWLPPHLSGKKAPPLVRKPHRPNFGPMDLAEALIETKGNKSLAAKRLGVSRSTLYRFFAAHRDFHLEN